MNSPATCGAFLKKSNDIYCQNQNYRAIGNEVQLQLKTFQRHLQQKDICMFVNLHIIACIEYVCELIFYFRFKMKRTDRQKGSE